MKDTEKETKGGDAGVKAHCDALVLICHQTNFMAVQQKG